MNRLIKAALAAAALAGVVFTVAVAQDEDRQHRFGDDLFAAGSDVRIAATGLEDVFAAGRTVVLAAPVRETAHMAGRSVRVDQAVGRDLYAAGSEVTVRAPVTGDITAAGDEVEIAAAVGDDILLAGRSLVVAATVGGNATLTGQTVQISGPISGSVQIRADNIRFGPNARIDGTLAYWSENRIEVPASVIPAERVTGKLVKARRGPVPAPAAKLAGVVTGLIVLLILGAVFAALVPNQLARARAGVTAHPWSHLLYGVVAASALFGSILVLLVSIIGIPLILVMLVVIPLALLAGYLTAAYVLGSLVLGLVRVRLGTGRPAAVAAVSAGLVLLGLIKLIPILGWIVAVIAVILALGAWFVIFARPRWTVPAAG